MDRLRKSEIRKISEQFSGVFKVRNKGLFILRMSTGADISELLALTIGDAYQKDKPVDKLFFNNRDDVSRTVPVNQDGTKAIQSLIDWHAEYYGSIDTQRLLFPSNKGKGKVALTSKSGHAMLKKAFIGAGLSYTQKTQPLHKPTVQRMHELAEYIFIARTQLNINTMPMCIRLNCEIEISHSQNKLLNSHPNASAKGLIIKLIRIVSWLEEGFWLTLREFIIEISEAIMGLLF